MGSSGIPHFLLITWAIFPRIWVVASLHLSWYKNQRRPVGRAQKSFRIVCINLWCSANHFCKMLSTKKWRNVTHLFNKYIPKTCTVPIYEEKDRVCSSSYYSNVRSMKLSLIHCYKAEGLQHWRLAAKGKLDSRLKRKRTSWATGKGSTLLTEKPLEGHRRGHGRGQL